MSDSSSQGGGSGGSDEEEGEGRRKRREEEREEGRSTGSLHGAGGEGEAGSPAAEGGNKAPKPKTPQQQVKHQWFATLLSMNTPNIHLLIMDGNLRSTPN